MSQAPVSPHVESRSGLPLSRILLGVALVLALIWLGRAAGGYVPVFRDWVAELGFWGPLVFVLGYAAAVVAFVPASLLTLAAGAIFGLLSGTAYVFFAALLGSSLAFLVSRYLARGAVERRIANDPRFGAIDAAVGGQGRRIVFLLRLSPVFPFNLLNYALGLTRVSLLDYSIGGLGMLPGTLLYVYLGRVGAEAAAVAGGAQSTGSSAETALLVVGLIATAVVTVSVTRIARRALAESTPVVAQPEFGDDTRP